MCCAQAKVQQQKKEEEAEVNYAQRASLTALASAVTPKWAKLMKPECHAGPCRLKRSGARQEQAPLELRGWTDTTQQPEPGARTVPGAGLRS